MFLDIINGRDIGIGSGVLASSSATMQLIFISLVDIILILISKSAKVLNIVAAIPGRSIMPAPTIETFAILSSTKTLLNSN